MEKFEENERYFVTDFCDINENHNSYESAKERVEELFDECSVDIGNYICIYKICKAFCRVNEIREVKIPAEKVNSEKKGK